jgi:cytochrome c biogenesis protein
VLEDDRGAGDLQIGAEHGRMSRVLLFVAHVALLLIVAGGALNAFYGFTGRVNLDEGARTGYIQVTRGKARGWPVYLDHGQPIPGFRVPGFEMECQHVEVTNYPGTNQARAVGSLIDFYVDGKLEAAREISINHPAYYRGLTLTQAGYSRSGQLSAELAIFDRKSENQEELSNAVAGSTLKLKDDSTVRVVQVQRDAEEKGAAVQLETLVGGQSVERFWVFEKYPGFDPVHRKKSRFYFILKSVSPRFTAQLTVTRSPGAPLVWSGAALMIAALLIGLLVWHNRYWFVWSPGRVVVVGWSDRFSLFEPEFARAMETFKSRLERMHRGTKAARLEVTHG